MESFRLDSISQAIAKQFRQARPDARCRAARIACEYSILATGLFSTDIEQALQLLSQGRPAEQSLRARLEKAASALDEEYFQLDEEFQLDKEGASGRKQEALRVFSQARAASALVFALVSENTNLHESIYEAITALDEPTPLLALVAEALT